MKIIAITERSDYDGSSRKYLLEITTQEIQTLVGTDWRDASNLKIGTELNIAELYNDVCKIRALYNSKADLTKRLIEACNGINEIKLPEETILK